MVRVGDILAWGLLLASIFLFGVSYNLENWFLKFVGLLSSVLIFISEFVYLYQNKFKWR